MIKKIARALIKRKLDKMNLADSADKAIQLAISHVMEERCICMMERMIQGPDGEMNDAIRMFFNHITPFHIDAEDTKIDTTIAKDPVKATDNLKEFAEKYDGKFSLWIAANGKTPEVMLESSFNA